MTIRDIQNDNIEIQGSVNYCYYDYEAEHRVFITRKEAADREIKYLYCEDGQLYIEVAAEPSEAELPDDLVERQTEQEAVLAEGKEDCT